MINSLSLRNFKSFDNEVVPFRPLTLLMGGNGAGKSSIIQSLLLLKQSADSVALDDDGLQLNGQYCSLGVGRDVLRQGADDERVGISFREMERAYDFEFGYEADKDFLPIIGKADSSAEFFIADLIYLPAERVGPRLTSPRSLANAAAREMGKGGEGAIAILDHYRADILAPDDPRRRDVAGSLEEIFQTYLADICPTARIDLKPYSNVDSIGSTFSFSAPGGIPGIPFRPTNVGFGLSYSLPIIVACLVAQPGSMIIIENPEAHLHTKSQRAMCELIALTATAGVQLVVETHSREFFYWLRRGAQDGRIEPDIGVINYIEPAYGDLGQRVSKCRSLNTLDEDLSQWPADFFDAFGTPTDLIAPI